MYEEKPNVFSEPAMGRASSRSVAYIEDSTAANLYQSILLQFSPDILVQNGAPSQEEARNRSKGLYSNAHFLNARDKSEFDILVPEEDYYWAQETLEEAAHKTEGEIYFSEEFLGRGLETAIDDAISAQKMISEGDELFYHTSSAHARALETAVDRVNEKHTNYQVFGFGYDTALEHFKQSTLNSFYQRFVPRDKI